MRERSRGRAVRRVPDVPPGGSGARRAPPRRPARAGRPPPGRGRVAQLPSPPRPGARRGLVAHAHGSPAAGAGDPRRPGPQPHRGDRRHALRGPPPRVRHRRRPHDERVGAERSPQEPRGAPAAVRTSCSSRLRREALRPTIRSRCQRLRFGAAAAAVGGGSGPARARGPRRGRVEPARAPSRGAAWGPRCACRAESYRGAARGASSGSSSAWTRPRRDSSGWRPPEALEQSGRPPRRVLTTCARSCATWPRCAPEPTAGPW